jgi:hypothetical protein
VTAGASAGLAFAAFAWFAPAPHEPTQRQTIDLAPKRVQTVSFKQEEMPSETAPASSPSRTDVPANDMPANAPVREAQADAAAGTGEAVAESAEPTVGTAAGQSRKAIGPKELIALWSGVPSDVTAQSPSNAPPVQAADASGDEPAHPADATPAHQTQAHVRHSHHHTRRHVAHKKEAPTETAPPTQETDAQPAANPLQSAWQTLFGHPVAGSSPATDTRAALQ